MQLPTEQALLAHITEFCNRNHVSLSQFGEQAVNDRGFVTRLKAGRSPSLKHARKIYLYMAKEEAIDV